MPNQLREFIPVLGVAIPPAFRGEIVLVPPLEFGFRRQWHLAGFLAADQIATDGYKRLHALRPKRRDNVGRASAPIEAGECRLLDPERVHESGDIYRQRRRLTVAEGFAG